MFNERGVNRLINKKFIKISEKEQIEVVGGTAIRSDDPAIIILNSLIKEAIENIKKKF